MKRVEFFPPNSYNNQQIKLFLYYENKNTIECKEFLFEPLCKKKIQFKNVLITKHTSAKNL